MTLSDSSLRFQRVIDSCSDPFAEISGDLLVTEWSHRAEDAFGWRRSEVLGKRVSDFVGEASGYVVDEGISILTSIIAGETNPDAAFPEVPPFIVEMRHRDGSMIPAICSAFVTAAEGGEIRVGLFAKVRGVSEKSVAHKGAAEAYQDTLTGLPNRTYFIRQLGKAVKDLGGDDGTPAGTVAVASFNLDRFNSINTAMGHEIGDDVLVAVASRLRKAGGVTRPLIARLGADQFLAMFTDPSEGAIDLAQTFAQRAVEEMAEPFSVRGREFYLTASFGLATTDNPTMKASTLLSNADAALHAGKKTGGKGKKVFGESMRKQIVDRLSTEHSLHRALDRRELTVFYQPVVDIKGSEAVGVEALIRWQHPEQGLVAPDRFIPVAEESGLIIPIGAWVLEEACKQLNIWQEGGDNSLAGMMEVNLSARQIDHPAIVSTIEAILQTTGMPPEHLTLEITESALMRDAVAALEVLRALKEIGVSLAIDDFGTGYSSLAYLQRFPLDVLKVDKSFVDHLGNSQGDEIVAAVVNLAHALGLKVVAEGVETEQQLGSLRELNCDYAQGYLFSRPVPAAELAGHF